MPYPISYLRDGRVWPNPKVKPVSWEVGGGGVEQPEGKILQHRWLHPPIFTLRTLYKQKPEYNVYSSLTTIKPKQVYRLKPHKTTKPIKFISAILNLM